MENPTKMDDFGVPLFQETPTYVHIFHHTSPYFNVDHCLVRWWFRIDGREFASIRHHGLLKGILAKSWVQLASASEAVKPS